MISSAQPVNLSWQLPGSWRALLLAASLSLLGACASSTPQPPTAALQAAETAINSADQARVEDYAALELNEARVKLAEARKAVIEDRMVAAERLAQQALVSAELAEARGEVARAQEVNDELRENFEALQQEMQRNQRPLQ